MATIILKLNGGLGNQMFQYAFAYVLYKKYGVDILFDFSAFEELEKSTTATTRNFELGAFNIVYRMATEEELNQVEPPKKMSKVQKFLWNSFKLEKFRPKSNAFLQTKPYQFDKSLLTPPLFLHYNGYFQNEKYFKEVRQDLIKCFSSEVQMDEKNQQIIKKIQETNSVSIHVRRGDYVTLESASQFHGTCPLEYYQRAIEHVAKHVRSPHFFLFSDDICWVVENLNINYPYTIVDVNHDKGWNDINLMKNCRHNIVANSSFSWWGAWLNENPQKIVVAPKKWIAKNPQKCKIVPDEWVKI